MTGRRGGREHGHSSLLRAAPRHPAEQAGHPFLGVDLPSVPRRSGDLDDRSACRSAGQAASTQCRSRSVSFEELSSGGAVVGASAAFERGRHSKESVESEELSSEELSSEELSASEDAVVRGAAADASSPAGVLLLAIGRVSPVPPPVSSPSADGGLSESPAVSPPDSPTDAAAVGTAVRRRTRTAERSVDDVRAGDGRGQVGIRARPGGRRAATARRRPTRSRGRRRSESRLESRRVSADQLAADRPPSGRRCCGRRCSVVGAAVVAARRRSGPCACRPGRRRRRAERRRDDPAHRTPRRSRGSPVPIGPSTRAATHRGTGRLQRRHHLTHRRVGGGQGQGLGRRGDRGRPGVRRFVHPDAGDDRAVAEGVAAEHRGDGEPRARRDRGPMGRRPGAGFEEVARAGDERPVHGVRGAAALPAEQGADGDEAVRLGVGGRDDGPHAGKVGCAAVPGSGGGCHVRRPFAGEQGERCRSCCLYDNAADHHTRRAHSDPCRRRVTVRTRRASPTARRARLPRPDERRHTDGRSGLSVTRAGSPPDFTRPDQPAPGWGVVEHLAYDRLGQPARPEDRDPARRRR